VTGSGSTVLFVVAAVFLLWQTYRGWRLGIIRAALRLAALIGSGFVGFYGGLLTGKATAFLFGLPDWFIGVPVGIFLLLATYIVLTLLSRLCFKRTEHQKSAFVRFIFGIGGALVGLAIGLVFLVAAVSGIRALSGMAEGRREAGDTTVAMRAFSDLKESVSETRAGELLAKADPIPESTYSLITKFARVMSDPSAVARMAESPEIATLLENPKILALAADPAVQTAARNRDLFSFITNPRLLELARDPEIAKAVMSIDLQKALDYALENPSVTPHKHSTLN